MRRARTKVIHHSININQLDKMYFVIKPTIHSLPQLCVTTIQPQNPDKNQTTIRVITIPALSHTTKDLYSRQLKKIF